MISSLMLSSQNFVLISTGIYIYKNWLTKTWLTRLENEIFPANCITVDVSNFFQCAPLFVVNNRI